MPRYLRPPPRIKVLEAAGAIADGRVHLKDGEAEVVSSTGTRRYRVIVSGTRVYSDDNGTIYRGYVGYPIIAVLMLKGVLPYEEKIGEALRGIPWKKLNEKYKRYAVVEELVMRQAEERGVSRETIEYFINVVMKKLTSLRLVFDENLAKQQRLPL